MIAPLFKRKKNGISYILTSIFIMNFSGTILENLDQSGKTHCKGKGGADKNGMITPLKKR